MLILLDLKHTATCWTWAHEGRLILAYREPSRVLSRSSLHFLCALVRLGIAFVFVLASHSVVIVIVVARVAGVASLDDAIE